MTYIEEADIVGDEPTQIAAALSAESMAIVRGFMGFNRVGQDEALCDLIDKGNLVDQAHRQGGRVVIRHMFPSWSDTDHMEGEELF